MENKTARYKRTLKGSVGAGMGALFNGSGRRYYVLEFKDSDLYHRAGDSQKIIIDQVELGRSSKCQVRFDDDTFPTVSRRHAAIVKDGDNWKIIQLSETNSTLVNGDPVSSERVLKNGDEIQLSSNGPRIGFIMPAGKQGLVSSIHITERLSLFRKQALRPYKYALACLAIILIVACSAGGYVISKQGDTILAQGDTIVAQGKQLASLFSDKKDKDKAITDLQKQLSKISNNRHRGTGSKRSPTSDPTPGRLTKMLKEVSPSVFAVITTVYCKLGDETVTYDTYQGTGFLMTDGTFVTARHCVEPWYFASDLNKIYALSMMSPSDCKIWAQIQAINGEGKVLDVKSTNFTTDDSYDTPSTTELTIGEETYQLETKIAFGSEASLGNDWAFCKTNSTGSIRNGSAYSKNLKAGTTVHMLGFPRGSGIGDGKNIIEPIYNSLTVSRDGLTKARCIMVSQGVDHGNSGGPVFLENNGHLYVIGIVSRGDFNSKYYNHLVPMCNLY